MINKINIISLGCSKNLVDTESLMKQFDANGFDVECDAENSDADTVIINTCGFIKEAKEESIETILMFAKAKKRGEVRHLYVMGCFSERYKTELEKGIPEVDRFFGKFDWKAILKHFKSTYRNDLSHKRIITTPSHYAYLKISEGCNRACSFCSIPSMTGKHVSKPITKIITEAESLASSGVKELLVIAQDLSFYGIDLYRESKLAELVNKLSSIEGIEWIKLHYAYPANFPIDVLDVMREKNNVCNYLDIALQHASNTMLRRMRRGITFEVTRRLIRLIRKKAPGITLRTTMMVGHPGETAHDFQILKEFVREMKFERMGAFMYSHEDNTYAEKFYNDDISLKVKQQRLDELMKIQQNVSKELNDNKLGKTFKVLIDREEGEYYVGRTEYDSPEVDPEVLIKKEQSLEIGNFYPVKITAVDEFDLFGTRTF